MTRVAVVAAVACLVLPLGAQVGWHEWQGSGVTLRSPLPPDRLASVVCDLETAARVLPHASTDGSALQVVAVSDARGIREWLPQFEGQRANPLGAYWQGVFGHHLVVRVDARPDERLRRILHEYAHYLTHLMHPDPPRWFDEGVSELWEHITIGRDAVVIGGPVPAHVRRLRSGKDWIPVRALVGADTVPAGRDSVTTMFYAQSWALIHYLLFEQLGGQVSLDRVPTLAELPTDEVLQAYVRGPMAGAVRVGAIRGTGPCAAPGATRLLSDRDALLGRARALADGERPEAALPLVERILTEAPEDAEWLEVLGFVHFMGNRPVEAAAVFDRLIATGRGTHVAYYYRAVLAEPVPERAGGAGLVPQVEYLRKAVALSPGFTPAVERLKELIGKELGLAIHPAL